MKAKNKDESEIFYVGIKQPGEVRRGLLESSKSFVEGLQRYERYKTVREEKASEILRFKEDAKELNKLISELRRILPKTKLKEIVVKAKSSKAAKPKKAPSKKVSKAAVKKKAKSPGGLERLEAELGDIETQLSKLR